jgi:hypothetical protein
MTPQNGLLVRRLDRLREARPRERPAIPQGRNRPAFDRRRERAERLALALGGRITEGPAGPVVWGPESAVELPLEPASLGELPYPLDPRRPIVCLDTETTGLATAAGTLVFLVGLGTWDGRIYRVRQLVLAEQPDEPAFLGALAAAIPADGWLVTYNGRSFDWPLVCARFRLHRRPPPSVAGHLDLLPVCRQLWRHRLTDARLATVEAGICGVARQDDLPGALIPARYLAYLRTGQAALLRAVAAHNRQDVVSLALLLGELASRLGNVDARRRAHPIDVAALGRAFARRGRLVEGLECYEVALERLASRPAPTRFDRLAAERARLLGRLGRRREAAAAWLAMAERGGPAAADAWIRVASHRERVERRFPDALGAAERAASLAARARAVGRPLRDVEADLDRRLPRLRRRIAAPTRADVQPLARSPSAARLVA